MVQGHVVPQAVSSSSAPSLITPFIAVLTVLEGLVGHIEGADHKPSCYTQLNNRQYNYMYISDWTAVQHDSFKT